MDNQIILSSPEDRDLERFNNIFYKDEFVKSWKRKGNRAEIELTSGWGSMPFWPLSAPDAHKGDKVRVWSDGSILIGISLFQRGDLIPIFYKTKIELDAEHKAWVEEWHKQQHEEFERDKSLLDAAYEDLPLPLKRRIDRFRAESPDFRWSEEAYEMIVCAEAGRLYKAALDPEFGRKLKEHKIKAPTESAKKLESYYWTAEEGTLDWEDTPENRLWAFDAINSKLNKYNYKLMKEILPEMDEGHSGNTWGHAVMFARILLKDGDEAKL